MTIYWYNTQGNEMVAKCSENINETKWLKDIVGTTVCMQLTETWNDENVNFIYWNHGMKK